MSLMALTKHLICLKTSTIHDRCEPRPLGEYAYLEAMRSLLSMYQVSVDVHVAQLHWTPLVCNDDVCILDHMRLSLMTCWNFPQYQFMKTSYTWMCPLFSVLLECEFTFKNTSMKSLPSNASIVVIWERKIKVKQSFHLAISVAWIKTCFT